MDNSHSLTQEEMWLIRKIRSVVNERNGNKTGILVEFEQGGYSVSSLTPKGKTKPTRKK